LRLDRYFRWALYAAFVVLLATGGVWLLVRQRADTLDSEFWSTLSANLLMIHGGVAMITLMLLGALVPLHLARLWRTRRNRIAGVTIAMLNAVLIVTAFGLYYSGSDTVRPLLSEIHWIAGLAFPVLLVVHIVLGRRQRSRGVAG